MQAFEPIKYIPKAVEPILKERFSEMAKTLTILTDDEWDAIRATKPKNTIWFQPGGQDDMLSSVADISIVGGSRGGGKSYILLMQALYDITNPNFRAIIFRKELDLRCNTRLQIHLDCFGYIGCSIFAKKKF